MTTLLRRLRVGTRLAIAMGLILLLLGVGAAVSLVGVRAQETAAHHVADLHELKRYVEQQRFYNADLTGWQAETAWTAYRSGTQVAMADDADSRAGFLASKAALQKDLANVPVELMSAF